MTERDPAPLHLSGTGFPFGSEPQGRRQPVFGAAAGQATGKMWENQLAGAGHFLRADSESCPPVETWFSQIGPGADRHPPRSWLGKPCHEKARNRARSFSRCDRTASARRSNQEVVRSLEAFFEFDYSCRDPSPIARDRNADDSKYDVNRSVNHWLSPPNSGAQVYLTISAHARHSLPHGTRGSVENALDKRSNAPIRKRPPPAFTGDFSHFNDLALRTPIAPPLAEQPPTPGVERYPATPRLL